MPSATCFNLDQSKILLSGNGHVFPDFLTPVLTELFFPKPLTTFFTCFCRGEKTPERKFASTGYRTHNHQVMSPTRSPLSHPGQTMIAIGGVVERVLSLPKINKGVTESREYRARSECTY